MEKNAMKASDYRFLIWLLAIGMVSSAMADTRLTPPYSDAETPKAMDLGALETLAADTPIDLTVALRLRNLDAAEEMLVAVSTPGAPQYRQFLTADQFVARFAPTRGDVAKVVASLANYKLAAKQTTATTLKVTGLPADVERAFSVSLHSYQVPAHGDAAGYTYRAPLGRATIPTEISGAIAAVLGFDTSPSLRSALAHAPAQLVARRLIADSSTTLDPFGFLTVVDFASLYDVNPLYSRGISGKGRTLGIMALANFTPSDAYTYWSALGLTANPNRIQVVYVDGGPGAPSDGGGSLETTLDVEQSGGIAPGANIITYLAPPTNQGFVDVYAAAIDANQADTLSISWLTGWEWFGNLENAPVTDPSTGKTVATTQAIHELLVRAALQGQSIFTPSGDGGAYTVNWQLACLGPYSAAHPDTCSEPLSVAYPASDPAMTAAGGTTLPGIQQYCLDDACTQIYTIDIRHERVSGTDYLDGLCRALGYDTPQSCGIFPLGGGGGVSFMFPLPLYQFGRSGVQLSQPGQIYQTSPSLAAENGVVGSYYALPAFYPGRNVPDVSFNADPSTGYIVYYTSSSYGFGEYPGYGGTSFVAPQLAGVSALLGQHVHSRLGLLNFALYFAPDSAAPNAPLHPIAYGDNWFYHGRNGYNPGAGLGTMDVWNFAEYLRNPL
jgi:subtilase family serine protease